MSIDADFRTADWCEKHDVYHSVSATIAEMDAELHSFLEKLSHRSSDALALIKKCFLGRNRTF